MYDYNDRKEANIELLLGVFAILILAAVLRFYHMIGTGAFSLRDILEVFALIVFSIIPYASAWRLESLSDQELAEFELLSGTAKE
jgi:hypothetical protein